METSYLNSDSQKISLQLEAEPLLKSAAAWSKFLAIMGYVSIGFMVIMALIMFFIGGMPIPGTTELHSPMLGGGVIQVGVGFIYLILAILYFFPVNYLYKFSKRIVLALKTRDTGTLTKGFGSLKSCFKFVGILTIVMICSYIIMIIVLAITYGSAVAQGNI